MTVKTKLVYMGIIFHYLPWKIKIFEETNHSHNYLFFPINYTSNGYNGV